MINFFMYNYFLLYDILKFLKKTIATYFIYLPHLNFLEINQFSLGQFLHLKSERRQLQVAPNFKLIVLIDTINCIK